MVQIRILGKRLATAMRVIGMGLRLPALEYLARADELITNLQRRKQNAEAELTAIYLFCSTAPAAQVELYPAVGRREADFRVKQPDESTWTTVEVMRRECDRFKENVRQTLIARYKIEPPGGVHTAPKPVIFRL